MSNDALAIEYVPADAVQRHPDNPRQGDVGAIHTSITKNGVYRPLIVQRSTGYILAGNHTYEAMLYSDMDEVPVVYRDVDDETARRIMLADNRTADLGDYDNAVLADLLQSLPDLDGTGYDGDDLDDLLTSLAEKDEEDREGWYTDKVTVPQYEIVGEQPTLDELWDDTKTRELIDTIDRTPDLPDDVADFLRHAAHRHTVFNYRKVAEYYPHAPATVQRLMEQSALVIVDLDDAIRFGFTKFHETLAEQQWEAEQDGAVE